MGMSLKYYDLTTGIKPIKDRYFCRSCDEYVNVNIVYYEKKQWMAGKNFMVVVCCKCNKKYWVKK